MIPLEQIQVASPCPADWGAMTGTNQVRFCQGCRKNVYNLSAMTHEAAQALVAEKEGRMCALFYTRADGTMITQDCPVGLRAARYRRVKKMSYAATLLLSCGTGLLRGAPTASAAPVKIKPAATIVKPPVPVHRPHHIMGKISPRRHTMGVPLPLAPMTHIKGKVAPPPAPAESK